MSWGRRCDMGCESWPDSDEYEFCHRCDEPTRRLRNLRPLDDPEANSLKLSLEFETFYELRCSERGIPSSGPLDDDLQAVAAN